MCGVLPAGPDSLALGWVHYHIRTTVVPLAYYNVCKSRVHFVLNIGSPVKIRPRVAHLSLGGVGLGSSSVGCVDMCRGGKMGIVLIMIICIVEQ